MSQSIAPTISWRIIFARKTGQYQEQSLQFKGRSNLTTQQQESIALSLIPKDCVVLDVFSVSGPVQQQPINVLDDFSLETIEGAV